MHLPARLILLGFLSSGALTAWGEKYVTLQHVSIDRCASAWFIKRFVDQDATFGFFVQGEKPPPGTGFGFFGAAYFNRGPDCTFTDLVKKHRQQNNPALQKMNTIVNDVMSWMQGPGSPSARLNNHIADLHDLAKSDATVFETIFPTFDLLYFKCGGDRKAYLEPARRYYDLIELQLLRRLLNDKGRQRVDRLLEPDTAASLRASGSALKTFLAVEVADSNGNSKLPLEEVIEVLNGNRASIGPPALGWMQDVLGDGVQIKRLDELFALTGAQVPGRELDKKALTFEKAIWTSPLWN